MECNPFRRRLRDSDRGKTGFAVQFEVEVEVVRIVLPKQCFNHSPSGRRKKEDRRTIFFMRREKIFLFCELLPPSRWKISWWADCTVHLLRFVLSHGPRIASGVQDLHFLVFVAVHEQYH